VAVARDGISPSGGDGKGGLGGVQVQGPGAMTGTAPVAAFALAE
jgi:hypothetical protein